MRDNLIDNAKGALIFLVVLGHYLEAIGGWQSTAPGAVLTLIYMFHMPAFVFLAGITAKRDQLGMRIANLAALLLMFQLAYVAPVTIISGEYPVGLLQPYWILWFILSLIWWMLLTPLIVRIPGALVISVGIAIAGGMVAASGYQLSVGRTLTFLPFFVAGQLYGKQILSSSQRHRRLHLAAAPGFIACALAFYLADFDRGWLYGSMPYTQLGFDDFAGATVRAGLLSLSTVGALSFFACLTNKRSLLTTAGRNSLAIFLLHGFPVIIFRNILERTGRPSDVLSVALAFVVSAVTAAVLMHPVFNAGIRALVARITKHCGARKGMVSQDAQSGQDTDHRGRGGENTLSSSSLR